MPNMNARDQVAILEQEIKMLKQDIKDTQELLRHIVLDINKITEPYPYDKCPTCKQDWYVGHSSRGGKRMRKLKLFRFESWNIRAAWMRTPDGMYFTPLFWGIWIRIPMPKNETNEHTMTEYKGDD